MKEEKLKEKPEEEDGEEEEQQAEEEEEGELEEGEIHPMVSITKINPDEIPEVSFLLTNVLFFFINKYKFFTRYQISS